MGHHNGSASQIKLAAEAGAKMITHLGNGCANEINRHQMVVLDEIGPKIGHQGGTRLQAFMDFHEQDNPEYYLEAS